MTALPSPAVESVSARRPPSDWTPAVYRRAGADGRHVARRRARHTDVWAAGTLPERWPPLCPFHRGNRRWLGHIESNLCEARWRFSQPTRKRHREAHRIWNDPSGCVLGCAAVSVPAARSTATPFTGAEFQAALIRMEHRLRARPVIEQLKVQVT